jgi:hypothetical protein
MTALTARRQASIADDAAFLIPSNAALAFDETHP